MNIPSKNLYFAVLHVVALVLAVEVFVLAKQNRELKNPTKRESSRNIQAGEVMSVDGLIPLQEMSFDTSKASIVYVFSTTCPFCEKNLESWKAMAEIARGESITVKGICLASTDSAAAYTQRHKLNFPVFVPENIQAFRETNHIGGVPNTILMSAQRVVNKVWLGQLSDEHMKEIVKAISANK